MADYDNTNRGSIWKNAEKETEKHPDFTGELNVNGTLFWVSAWKRKEGASDISPALSFQIKPKEEGSQVKKPVAPSKPDNFDDDIPFK